MHRVPNHPQGLHYSDHLAVYALFEIEANEQSEKPSHRHEWEKIDEEQRTLLRSACIIVEETIQRLQRDRVRWALLALVILALLFYFHRPLWSMSSVFLIILILFKDLFCCIALSICVWFIWLGKPMERNALRAVQNAMYLRLRTSEFFH